MNENVWVFLLYMRMYNQTVVTGAIVIGMKILCLPMLHTFKLHTKCLKECSIIRVALMHLLCEPEILGRPWAGCWFA